TRAIERVVEGDVRVIMAGHKTGDIYYTKRDGAETYVYATSVTTKATRQIAKLPRGGVSSINADETLMLGVYTEGDTGRGGGGGRRGGKAAGAPAATEPPPGMSNTSASQPNSGGTNATFQANYRANWPDGTPMTFAEAKEFSLHNRLLA